MPPCCVSIVLAVMAFWLFAQTTLNIAPTSRDVLQISDSLSNIAVIALLFNALMVIITIVVIIITVPENDPRSDPSPVRATCSSLNASVSAIAKPMLCCAVDTAMELALGR
jgi:NADH:ubiquinone oxidoreductase subunit 6 (subunit J)